MKRNLEGDDDYVESNRILKEAREYREREKRLGRDYASLETILESNERAAPRRRRLSGSVIDNFPDEDDDDDEESLATQPDAVDQAAEIMEELREAFADAPAPPPREEAAPPAVPARRIGASLPFPAPPAAARRAPVAVAAVGHPMAERIKYSVARRACALIRDAKYAKEVANGDRRLPRKYVNRDGSMRMYYNRKTGSTMPLARAKYDSVMDALKEFYSDVTAHGFAQYLDQSVPLNGYQRAPSVTRCLRELTDGSGRV